MSTYTPEQFERLPKWAKALVRSAEIKAKTAKDMLERAEALVADADILSIDRGLPEEHNAQLRGEVSVFREWDMDGVPAGRERDEFHFRPVPSRSTRGYYVRLEPYGSLQVSGSSRLVIRIQAGNIVYFSLED